MTTSTAAARKSLTRDAMFRSGAKGHHADQVANAVLKHGYLAALTSAVEMLRTFPPHHRTYRTRLVAKNLATPASVIEWMLEHK